MWLLFHRNAKTRHVRDGETFVEKCPECGKRATFTEVEISENFGMFFVDIVGDKERAFRCGYCGEVFDLKDRGERSEAPAPAKPTKSLAELEAEAAAEQARRREAAAVKAVRLDDELAALKKKMGR